MKTIIIISIVLLTLQVHAQEVDSMKLGISAGGMVSFARGIDVKQTKNDIKNNESLQGSRYMPKLGIQLGANLDYQLSKTFSAGMGLVYNQRGWIFRLEEHENEDYGIVKQNVTINYLDIPLIISYHTSEKFSLKGGILTSIATTTKVKRKAETLVSGEVSETNAVNTFNEVFFNYDPKRVLLGLYVGCGIQLSTDMALDIHIQKTATIQPQLNDYANLSLGISLIKQFSINVPDLPSSKTQGPKVIE